MRQGLLHVAVAWFAVSRKRAAPMSETEWSISSWLIIIGRKIFQLPQSLVDRLDSENVNDSPSTHDIDRRQAGIIRDLACVSKT